MPNLKINRAAAGRPGRRGVAGRRSAPCGPHVPCRRSVVRGPWSVVGGGVAGASGGVGGTGRTEPATQWCGADELDTSSGSGRMAPMAPKKVSHCVVLVRDDGESERDHIRIMLRAM